MTQRPFPLIFKRAALALVFAVASALTAKGDVTRQKNIPESQGYVLRVWDVDEGLPSGSVGGIAQTPDGYLWVTTAEGLARFDGVRFTRFRADSTPGLPSDNWQTILTDHNGTLWVAVEGGGFSRRSEGRFQVSVPVPLHRPSQPFGIRSPVEDASGVIWGGYKSGKRVARLQNGRLIVKDLAPGHGGRDLFLTKASDGRLWYNCGNECGVFDGKSLRRVDTAPGSIVLAASRDGKMWGARANTLVQYNPDGRWVPIADLGDIAQDSNIAVLYEDHLGGLWLGTARSGLFRFENGKFEHVPTSHVAISCIFEDRDGNIWVGTDGGGLDCLRARRFSLRQIADGLNSTRLLSLCEDVDGRLWLLARRDRPKRSVDSTNSSFALPPGLDHLGLAVAMCPDPAGGIWFALATGGVQHWRDGVLTREPIQEKTTALLLDRTGDLWAAAISGPLIRLHQGVATPVSTEGGLVDARALAEDGAGRLWVGTEDGLVFRKQNDRFVKVPLPGARAGECVQFIVADGSEQVWIGLQRTGVYRWRAGRVERLSSHTETPVTDVRSMAIEPSGDFWIGTVHGLFRVQRSEIEAVMDGRQKTMRCNWFGRADGLPHIEFSFGYRNVTARTRDGHLWFATSSGALDINPPRSPVSHSLSPVLIDQIEEAGKVLTPDGKQYLVGPNPKALQIRYTLPELSQPDQLCFRYRLVGLGESEWNPAGSQRIATFTNLPPGHFRFEVEGCEPGGAWLPPASVAITVRAAWWQTLWFRLGVTLAGIGGITLFVRQIERSRYRRRMRALEEKNAVERERARIARDMHDELGATLTQVTLRSEIASRLPELAGAGARELGSIAKAVRSVSVTLDEIVWALNPSNDTLEQLAGYIAEFATEYLQATGIELDTGFSIKHGETRVTSNTRHQVVLAVKEVLNNIVKHSGAGEVTLKIAADASGVKISIADDGKGFDSASVSAFGNGVRNIQQRLSSIRGSAKFSSQPGSGTQISFDVPL